MLENCIKVTCLTIKYYKELTKSKLPSTAQK